jgi:hypothetical protein
MLVSSPESFPNLKAIFFLTNFKTWGEREPCTLEGMLHHHFQVKRLGGIRELTGTYESPETKQSVTVKYYAHLNPDNQILTCFTQATREQMQATIDPLTDLVGIYYLWISPVAFDEIKKGIFSEHPYTKIPFFSADRYPSLGLSAKLRPEFKRTFTYYGDDGRETLEELRYYYGVLPRSVEFRIPGLVDFRINYRGVFHYNSGSLEHMFQYANKTAGLVLEVRRILGDSKLEIRAIETATKQLLVPYVIPWRIEFKRHLEVSDVELLMEELERNRFAVYNSVVTEGSVRFDGTVFDEQKSSVFMISSDGHRMIVSPRYQNSFDSFLRFYETIAENFDPEASCVAVA